MLFRHTDERGQGTRHGKDRDHHQHLPANDKIHLIQTMPMKRLQPISILFEDEFWEAH